MDTASGWSAPAYFLSFYLLSSFVVLNLVIASILCAVQGGLDEVPTTTYMVSGAGIAAVNGEYIYYDERNGTHSYTNGDTMLFRSRSAKYWYLADFNDLKSRDSEYYRVMSDDETPALDGWGCEGCLAAVSPAPTLRALDPDDTAETSENDAISKDEQDKPEQTVVCVGDAAPEAQGVVLSRLQSWSRRLNNQLWFHLFMLGHVLVSVFVLCWDSSTGRYGPYAYRGFRVFENCLNIYLIFVFSFEGLVKIGANGLISKPVSNKIAPVPEQNETEDGPAETENKLDSAAAGELVANETDAGEESVWRRWTKDFTNEIAKDELPYLRSPWSVISGFVLLGAIYDLGICGTVTIDGVCSRWRLGRAARPFRIMAYSRGMQRIGEAFFNALAPLCSIILMTNILYFCFAILAVNLFGNRLQWCLDSNQPHRDSCVGTYNGDYDFPVPRVPLTTLVCMSLRVAPTGVGELVAKLR